jgi:hypothetical protein
MLKQSVFDYHLGFARFLATLLDNQFSIGSFKFGIGPIIGIIPGIGDIIENILSFYLIWIALKMNLPNNKIGQMLINIGFNFFLALFPVIGNIGDFIFKSNIRNLKILEEHVKRPVIEGEIIVSS